MQIFCSYHPTKPASWDCGACDSLLCEDCVVCRKVNQLGVTKEFHLCPKCNQEVKWLGVSNLLEPFWNRLPRFFIYPFSLRPLILNLILCLAMLFFSGTSLFNNLARFAIWGIWLKYSFSALQTTAKGNLNPPDVTAQNISENFQEVFKQLGIYFALAFFFGIVVNLFGKSFGILYGAIALLFLPSMIILLVSTQSLFQALNPFAFLRLPFRIGGGYLLMYFFLITLGGAPVVILNLTIKFLPMAMVPIITIFFKNYYTLISYNLMGYVLLQYHEEIGYDVDYEDFAKETSKKKTPASPASPLLNEIEIHVKDGNYDQALKIIQTEININNSNDLDIFDRYYRLLKLKNMSSDMLSHGKKYIDILIESNIKSKAIEIYIECSDVDKQFAPGSKGFVKLAGWLKKAGHSNEAIRAYSTFTKIYSNDPMIPNVYFRAAEIFNERLGQKTKARNLLNGLIKKYPDHDIIPFVRNYLKGITI